MTTDPSLSVATSTLTFAEIAHLPVMVDLLTAARALGIGRTTAYTLARTHEFPCPVVRVGGAYKVPTAGLMRLLDLDEDTHIKPQGHARGTRSNRAKGRALIE